MSKKNQPFFNRLSSKVEKQILNPEFDRDFWKKFDQEFSESNSSLSFLSNLKSLFFAQGSLYPVAALAGLLIVFGVYSRLPNEEGKKGEMLSAVEWSEGVEIAQDLELFEEMASEDWVLTATDEDWEVLLDENET